MIPNAIASGAPLGGIAYSGLVNSKKWAMGDNGKRSFSNISPFVQSMMTYTSYTTLLP